MGTGIVHCPCRVEFRPHSKLQIPYFFPKIWMRNLNFENQNVLKFTKLFKMWPGLKCAHTNGTGILRKLSYIMSIHNSKNSDPPLYWWFPHNSVSRKYSQLEVKSNSTPLSWLLQRFSLYRCWWRHHFFFAVTVIQILSLFLWWVAHIRGQSEVE